MSNPNKPTFTPQLDPEFVDWKVVDKLLNAVCYSLAALGITEAPINDEPIRELKQLPKSTIYG